jgi:hypothetical protein
MLCQQWNGRFFDTDSLQNHGLRYQLGHSGGLCPSPLPGPKHFTVFDLSGPLSISIDYCNCTSVPVPLWTQLLRQRWFPATLSRPQTVFTFDCLEFFHELTLQGKTNLYDFYHTLLRRFDNAKILGPIVCRFTHTIYAFLIHFNRTVMLSSTACFECGGTLWLSSELVELTILRE